MPRYMTSVLGPENQGRPPQALFDAIDQLSNEGMKQGVLVGFGGLKPTARGARATLEDGKVVFTDGPFTEAKEVLGGFAIYDLPNLEAAKAWTEKFLALHAQHWPAFRGIVEIREMQVLEGVTPK